MKHALPALALFLAVGCGGRERPPVEVPTKEQVRDFYGLNAGSCWQYKFNGNLQRSIVVSEPNDKVIAGKIVYVVNFSHAGGGLADQWYLDAETAPEIRLLRTITGMNEAERVTAKYGDMPPLFAKFVLTMGEAELTPGDRFETQTTPLDKNDAPLPIEEHRWTVQRDDEIVTTSTGAAAAVTMEYRRNGRSSTYWLVPGYGFAKFQDFDATTYQVCAARVCDSTGACEGVQDCTTASLVCPR